MEKIAVKELLKNEKWYGKNCFFPVLLSILVAALFSISLPYGFLTDWDDHAFIVQNPLLVPSKENILTLSTSTFQDLYTPLPMLSFMLDKALFGLNPSLFRLENLLWHIVAALFLYGILRQLHIKNFIAFAGALLWAIHPQKVESIVWITERKDVLCGAFFFASIWFFLRSLRREKIPFAAATAGLLALASKPAAAPLPGIMILAAFCLYGKKRSFSAYCKVLLLPLLLFAGMIFYSYHVTSKGFPGGLEKNYFVVFHNLFWYPFTSLIPFELNPMYPNLKEWAWRRNFLIPGCIGVLLLLFLLYKSKLSPKIYWTFLLVTGGTLVPVLGLLSYTAMDHCDRYNYLVSGCISAFVCVAASRYLKEKKEYGKKFLLLFIVLVLLYSFRTLSYIPVWKNCDTLFTYAIVHGRPCNHTAVENGVMSAIKSNNASLMRQFAFYMLYDFEKYFPEAVYLQHTALFFTAHAALLEGKKSEALEHYRTLALLIRNGTLDLMNPSEFLPVLMRGGAEICFASNAFAEAQLFFGEYFKVKKEKTKEYYYMQEKYHILQKKIRNTVFSL